MELLVSMLGLYVCAYVGVYVCVLSNMDQEPRCPRSAECRYILEKRTVERLWVSKYSASLTSCPVYPLAFLR